MIRLGPKARVVVSWALYDWANSAFATTVMSGFFPIFFKDCWGRDLQATQSTFWLGVTVSCAGLIVALLAPVLGAMADQGGRKKRSLMAFAALGILATVGLYFVPAGLWPIAAALYGLGLIGFLCSLVFYDALIVGVSASSSVDRVSSFGYALGYLGGGLLFLLNVCMVAHPSAFGLDGPAQAVRLSFVTAAVWWAVFSMPLVAAVPEPGGGRRLSLLQAARAGFGQVARTVREIRRTPEIVMFLAAYWFYIDGVDTVITMAVDYGKSVGFQTMDLVSALLIVQFVGFPCTYVIGLLASRWGTKRMILLCLAAYLAVSLLGSRIDPAPCRLFGFSVSKFYLITVMIAMFQGGTQALSRAFYARIIPPGREAEFFGFYNMLGKFAAIAGPLLMGAVARATGNPRMGMLSLALLFIVGGVLLWRVPAPRPAPGAE